jgi:CPA1 family monovalent cation:H+ antiporter
LSLQYPGYAESIYARQLERAAIRFESLEYSRRLHESIISREVYTELRRDLNKRRQAAASRPALDLGFELVQMIGRVSLFTGLDRQAVRELGRLLRPRMAIPGEKVVEIGGASDAMYFIAAGEVEVHVGHVVVRLKEGDFFGEMGLLDSKPRVADVIAEGYCHLLVLDRRDFNALLAKRPELRTGIEAVAASRAAPAPAEPTVAN